MSGRDARRAKRRKAPVTIYVTCPPWNPFPVNGPLVAINADTGEQTMLGPNVRVRLTWEGRVWR